MLKWKMMGGQGFLAADLEGEWRVRGVIAIEVVGKGWAAA